MSRTLPTVAPAQRPLVVRAYAHSIMEDLLTDHALTGEPLPADLAALRAIPHWYDLGGRFEECFLQGNAPQWSIGEKDGAPIRDEALALVGAWLIAMGEHDGHISELE